MNYHFTELLARDLIRAFVEGLDMVGLQFNDGDLDGADAWAWKGSERIEFEIKACMERVKDKSKPCGTRPGRFRVDPDQYDTYGTEFLYYLFVVYRPTRWGFDMETGARRAIGGEIVKSKFVRSDNLPQKDTIFGLSISKVF